MEFDTYELKGPTNVRYKFVKFTYWKILAVISRSILSFGWDYIKQYIYRVAQKSKPLSSIIIKSY